MGTIDAPHAALYGAIIGLIGGAVAQVLGRLLTYIGDRADRLRREKRTLEAFRGMLNTLAAVVNAMVATGVVPKPSLIEYALAPLRKGMEDPGLYLGLSPEQVASAFRAFAAGNALFTWISFAHDELDARRITLDDFRSRATPLIADAQTTLYATADVFGLVDVSNSRAASD